MADIAKAIKGLEWILKDDRFGFGKGLTKPETDEEQAGCYIHDAIELLKEQLQQKLVDPVKPIDSDDDFTWLCNYCKGELFFGDRIRDNYCSTCGRKINWYFVT